MPELYNMIESFIYTNFMACLSSHLHDFVIIEELKNFYYILDNWMTLSLRVSVANQVLQIYNKKIKIRNHDLSVLKKNEIASIKLTWELN